jgi:hypothetical protein
MAIDLNALRYKLNPTSYANDADKAYYENAGDFVGYDASGNAIFDKGGNYSAFDKTNFAGLHNSLASDAKTRNMQFTDYQSATQASTLGDYQGIDKETGSAVFQKDGQYSGINQQDFGDLFGYIQKNNAPKQWIDPRYEQEFNAKNAAGNQFQGVDASGQAVVKNALGQYEKVGDPNSGYAKFAKLNLSDQKFAGPTGVTNITKNENLNTATPIAGQQRATATNTSNIGLKNRGGSFSKFSSSQQPASSAQQQQTAQTSTYSPQQQTTQASPTFPSANAPSSTKSSSTPARSVGARAYTSTQQTQAKPATSPTAPTPMTNVFNQPSLFDTAKQMATGYAQNQVNSAVGQAKDTAKTEATNYVQGQLAPVNQQVANTLGVDMGAVSNPAAYARQLALQNASSVAKNQAASLGINTSALGDTSKILSNPAEYAKKQAMDAISKQYGFDASVLSNPLQYAQNLAGEKLTSQLGFNPLTALKDPVAVAKQIAKEKVIETLGFDPEEVVSDPVEAARRAAIKKAKGMALSYATETLTSQFGDQAAEAVPYGAMIKGGLDVGRELTKGGLNENSADAAGQAAARAALAAYTGGVVSPETLAIASTLQNKGYDLTKGLMGNTAGSVLGSGFKAAAIGSQAGSELLNTGIKSVGSSAANSFNAVKNSLGGLKQISKGNVLGGATSVAKALGNFSSNAIIKAPVAVAKQVASTVSNAIKSIFCFDGETEILMEDGDYKKIKTLKVGDRIALGGMITAIGQGLTSNLYDYNGVKVSGGHAVYENKKWTRVEKSKDGKDLNIKENVIVYPMASEHHLIVTKNQVWADSEEVNNTYDKKDSEIMKELNSKKRRNKMLDVYLKSTFGEENGSSDNKKVQKK